MIATIQFNLDSIDDQKHHIRMLKSNQMAIALWKIQNHLYQDISKDDELSPEQEYLFTKIIEWLNDTLEQYHIYPDDLTS